MFFTCNKTEPLLRAARTTSKKLRPQDCLGRTPLFQCSWNSSWMRIPCFKLTGCYSVTFWRGLQSAEAQLLPCSYISCTTKAPLTGEENGLVTYMRLHRRFLGKSPFPSREVYIHYIFCFKIEFKDIFKDNFLLNTYIYRILFSQEIFHIVL